MNEPSKRDWYFAHLLYEVTILPYRIWGKKPPADITPKKCLLKFDRPEVDKDRPLTEDEEAELLKHIKAEQAAVVAALGATFQGAQGDAPPVQFKLPPGMQPPPGSPLLGRDIAVKTAAPPPAPPAPAGPPPGFTPTGKKRSRRGP